MSEAQPPFFINGRFANHRVTGVQRYALELSRRFVSNPKTVKPAKTTNGLKGHLWEQLVLARKYPRQLLWSPCNTGPILRKRQVVTIHDIIPIEHPEWFNKKFAAIYAELIPRVVESSAHVIAVSRYTKERIVTRLRIDPSKVTTILNGVGEQFFPRSQAEIDEMRAKLNIPRVPYILTVSSIEPRKNLNTLLAAWQMLEGTLEECMLVIAGSGAPKVFGKQEEPLKSGRTKYLGYVPEELLPALYSGATGFVYPSLCEGFGLPVLEASACGIATVTSNSTSLPEASGPHTTLVDPKSPAEIASAITKMFNSSLTDDGRSVHCVEHAKTFTWTRSAQLTEHLLLSLS